MTQFFFHLKDGDQLIQDYEDNELPDLVLARAQALKSTREIWADAIRAGDEALSDAFGHCG
jgi:hypothetical protein